MTKRYLTKSRFKTALECPTKLFYLNKSEYDDIKEGDGFLQALAEGGYQVGELAKLYYPGGHDSTDRGYLKPLEKTYELLKQDDVIIYEAAILFENLFVRVDVLVKQGNKIKLIEVKAKSYDGKGVDTFVNHSGFIVSKWKPYLYDVAFQKYVMALAFPEYQIESYLMLADKTKITSVDGLNQKIQLVKDAEGEIGVKLVGNVSPEALGNPILTAVDVSELVERIHDGTDSQVVPQYGFADLVSRLASAYENDDKLVNTLGNHCAKCEFRSYDTHKKSGFNECWKQQTSLTNSDLQKPLVLDLWSFSRKQHCIKQGKYLMCDLEKADIGNIADFSDEQLTKQQRQWLQVEKVKNNDSTAYLNRRGLKKELELHRYPLHFIDFETAMVAIPFYNNTPPYEQIAFQYSHHVMYEDGRVEHKSQFIATEKEQFPNFDFVRALQQDLEQDDGSIFRFAAHENTVLKQIKTQLIEKTEIQVDDREQLIQFIDTVTQGGARSMVDLCEIVEHHYYDPYTKGSNSIKAILPAVLQRSEYIQNRYGQPIYGKGCEISSLNFDQPQTWLQTGGSGDIVSPYKLLPDIFEGVAEEIARSFMTAHELSEGGDALTAYAKMQFPEMTVEEKELVIKGLLRYCELDTLAMVMIYEYWLSELRSE